MATDSKADWGRTPRLGFNVLEAPGCWKLTDIVEPEEGWIAPLRWEQLYIHEYRSDGSREYAMPRLSDAVVVGQSACAFAETGYYDLVYRPTALKSFFRYPKCAGDFGTQPGNDNPDCWPPRDWPE